MEVQRLKIFILLSRFPYPLIKGDKLRAFNQIKGLSKNHDVYLCALADKKVSNEAKEFLSPYCKEIKIIHLSKLGIFFNIISVFLFTKLPLQVGYFYQRRAKKQIKSYLDSIAPDHIYCQLIRTTEYVRKITGVPKTLDYMDSLSSGMQRRYLKANWYSKWIFKIEMNRLKRYEHFIFNDFEHATIIAERDRNYIVNYHHNDINIVENGVDLVHFTPEVMDKKYDLLFTGNMSYPPNIEAAFYLVNDILPKVLVQKPNIKLVIAGAHPSKRLESIKSKHVEFTGWVPDLRMYFNQSKIFIAPMQIGSGLQNKLLEAMAMKLPCITSDLANKSLLAKENEEILIGRNTDEYANLIIALLDNEIEAARIAQNGFQFVKQNYNWDVSNKKLNEIFESKF